MKKQLRTDKRICRRVLAIITGLFMLLTMSTAVFADTWVFESSGNNQNPFTPRGFLVDTGRGQQWLASKFSNEGERVVYSGKDNGLDYIKAESSYRLYAMTERNPSAEYQYLAAWRNGKRISGFGSMASAPGRGESLDPSGNGACWVIPISGFRFEPGSYYEFAFLQGMQANNGITLVLSEDGRGYIQAPMTAAEKKRYDSLKMEEYEFLSNYSKTTDEEGNTSFDNLKFVPMRFSVQTYADMSTWEEARAEGETFLSSITDADYAQGNYRQSNVTKLIALMKTLDEEAENTVRKQIQNISTTNQKAMARELREMIDFVKSDKPQPADLKKLKSKIKEAESFYNTIRDNVGSETGQYNKVEVDALADEITRAKKITVYDEQSVVENEIRALDEAITEAKLSRKSPSYRVFTDKATGIIVVAPPEAFPQDASMVVKRIAKDSSLFQKVARNLSDQENRRIIYDIRFFDGDSNQIESDKKVQVQIPIDGSMSGMSVSLSRVDESGSISVIRTAQADGYKVFKTDELGRFLMSAHKTTKKEKTAMQKALKAAQASAANGNGSNKSGGSEQASAENKKSMDITKSIERPQAKKATEKKKELKEKEKEKEEFKPPSDKDVERSVNNTSLNENVTREGRPKYLVFAAIALAAIALLAGIRILMDNERRKK